MAWNKPKKFWHWLLLLSPGAASLLCTAFNYLMVPGRDVSVALLGYLAVIPLCVVVAWFLVRRTGSPGSVFGFGCLFTVLLIIVNLSIASGGCAAMPLHMDFK